MSVELACRDGLLAAAVLTLTFVLSPLRLEIWNKTPSKSATVTSIDSGLLLQKDNRRLSVNWMIVLVASCEWSVENSHDHQDCVIKTLALHARMRRGEKTRSSSNHWWVTALISSIMTVMPHPALRKYITSKSFFISEIVFFGFSIADKVRAFDSPITAWGELNRRFMNLRSSLTSSYVHYINNCTWVGFYGFYHRRSLRLSLSACKGIKCR